MRAEERREVVLFARKCALVDGFSEGCEVGSGDNDWLDKRLSEPVFRDAYIGALHQRIVELEQQLRADQIEAAKKAVLFE